MLYTEQTENSIVLFYLLLYFFIICRMISFFFFCKHQSLKFCPHITSIGFDMNLSFINSRRMMGIKGTWFDISLPQLFSFWSSSSGSHCISPPFRLFHLELFFVMSSFSCETLYGELHLFTIIIIKLFWKMCLAQII